MNLQVQLSGTLDAGPAQVTDGCFPPGSTQVPLVLSPPCKSYGVTTGDQVATVASPNAFVQLGGIGTNGPVTHAHTLYVRTSTPMALRLTQADSSVKAIPAVSGLLVIEFGAGFELTELEVEGSGQIEYAAFGTT